MKNAKLTLKVKEFLSDYQGPKDSRATRLADAGLAIDKKQGAQLVEAYDSFVSKRKL